MIVRIGSLFELLADVEGFGTPPKSQNQAIGGKLTIEKSVKNILSPIDLEFALNALFLTCHSRRGGGYAAFAHAAFDWL